MVVKKLVCKMTLEINGEKVVCNFVSTKKKLKEDAEFALKQDLFMVLT
jgi:hypothetical protein